MSDATRTRDPGVGPAPLTAPPSGAVGTAPLPARSRIADPRYLIAGLITLVLLAAQLRYHMVGGYARLAVALGTCVATEALLSWFVRGKVVNLQSAYISGISLTLLIKPQGATLWPFVLGGFLAIASKYVLQYRSNHVWNPTNFAIVVLLLAATNRISVLSHQWGNDLATNLVIWVFSFSMRCALSRWVNPCSPRSRRSRGRCISCSSSS